MPKSELAALGLIPEIKANHRVAWNAGKEFVKHALETGRLLIQAKPGITHGWGAPMRRCRCLSPKSVSSRGGGGMQGLACSALMVT